MKDGKILQLKGSILIHPKYLRKAETEQLAGPIDILMVIVSIRFSVFNVDIILLHGMTMSLHR